MLTVIPCLAVQRFRFNCRYAALRTILSVRAWNAPVSTDSPDVWHVVSRRARELLRAVVWAVVALLADVSLGRNHIPVRLTLLDIKWVTRRRCARALRAEKSSLTLPTSIRLLFHVRIGTVVPLRALLHNACSTRAVVPRLANISTVHPLLIAPYT